MASRAAVKHPPLYGWALTQDGTPIPIGAAQRGETYICPVCRHPVVPKLGEINQHHFAHVDLMLCDPEAVARSVAGIWLTRTLREAIAQKKPVYAAWQPAHQESTHQLDVLKHVVRVEPNHPLPFGKADIALLNADNQAIAVIVLGLHITPTQAKLAEWVQNNVAVILLNSVIVRNGTIHPDNLLGSATVMGGWLLLEGEGLSKDIILDPDKIRKYLKESVSQESPIFYGELSAVGPLGDVLTIKDHKLWLPLELWQQIVGGTKNPLGPDVNVYIQEWKESDGCKLQLFYITARKTAAVAVKYASKGQGVTLRLDPSFRRNQTTALELARQLSSQ